MLLPGFQKLLQFQQAQPLLEWTPNSCLTPVHPWQPDPSPDPLTSASSHVHTHYHQG